MLFKVENFLGINNVDDDKRVNKPTFTRDGNVVLSGDLKSCSNFRIPKDGVIKVRNGFARKVTLTDGHSYWANPSGKLALLVDGTTLKKVATDYTTSNIKTGLVATGLKMRYAEHNQMIFMGNKEQMLKYNYLDLTPSVTNWLVTGDYTGAMGWSTDSEGALLMPAEFDLPQTGYIAPPNSNILISHYARMFVASGRFLFYSESLFPELFHPDYYISCSEDITAISRDAGNLYVHTLNTSKALIGRDPDDFQEIEYNIGAVPQKIMSPPEYDLPYPVFMSRKGWAYASGSKIDYIDKENFRLDLPSGSVGYLGYDIQNREILSLVLG